VRFAFGRNDSLRLLADIVLVFVALYPVVMAGVWVSGGALFRIFEEGDPAEPDAGWPGVTILVPAYNEASVIAVNVRAARAVEYPDLEILVLDDGSTDETVSVARAAADGDERVEVVGDPVNRGKAERLNVGFARARNELVVLTDADTHLHPLAIKLLVSRIARSPRIVAVAGAPHVTNRRSLLATLQSLEAASIIGLTRRTQALGGRMAIVAGVLGIFRRTPVIEVGGYDGRMATEDIDLTWRLLMAGWLTAYEPNALVGMQVPSTLSSLWRQRRRWSRGQSEVLHDHFGTILRPRSWRIWIVALGAALSLAWVVGLVLALLLATLALFLDRPTMFEFGLAWGIAVAVVATVQLAFAVAIDARYDRPAAFAFFLGPLYPLGYWAITALAALRELPSLVRGPREQRVVWDLPREPV
jgi:biofilm PGA synthesis N-glycosyltransferase PgaC